MAAELPDGLPALARGSRQGEPTAWRRLSDADRAYRAAFRSLTSRGGMGRSTRTSLSELVAATQRLESAALDVLLSREDTPVADHGRETHA